MKWFKHETDAHMSMKLQSVVEKFGVGGLGYYWSLVELVGKNGENYRISFKKDWKTHLKKFLNIELEVQSMYLEYFSDIGLIEKKALNKGDLYIPKLAERSDDYTNKVKRKSVHGTDNIPLEENRTEENRLDKKRTYGEFAKVLLSEEEHSKLIERMGEKNTSVLIDELDGYIASKGKRYSSHYATILTWARKKLSDHQRQSLSKGKKII